jgi:L-tyrosine isonitrile synthase
MSMHNIKQERNRGVSGIAAELASTRLVQSFNTWAFKRQQPSNLGLLHAHALTAVTQQTPLEFVLYWGKGPRSEIAGPDLECLSYLVSMRQRIEAAHSPGAQFTLLFTDTHARLNRHSVVSSDQYFREVGAAAKGYNMFSRRLSGVLEFALRSSAEPAKMSPHPEILSRLTRCATKWYLGDEIAEEAASAYFSMNMHEKHAVEQTFPCAVFATFNSSQFQALFPDNMPIFYMYSLRKGCAIKPWFMANTENNDLPILAPRNNPVSMRAQVL